VLVERAVELLGGIDLLVIAASLSGLQLLRDTTSDDWERVLRTNVIGPSLLVREALPHLPEAAVVALLSSESVGQPYPGIVPYTVSKAALEELVRGWRAEHPALRFSCVTVGATGDTDFSRDFDMELGAKLFPTWVALGKLPARFMTSRDLGAAIADSLAVAVNTPGIDVQQLTFRPPGGPHTGDTDFMLDVVSGAAARK
jgi:NAD(P)-dependent dehydrogenase (short-subunit alcohol dehydrogenase family)